MNKIGKTKMILIEQSPLPAGFGPGVLPPMGTLCPCPRGHGDVSAITWHRGTATEATYLLDDEWFHCMLV